MEAKFEELIEGYITGNIGISEAFLTKELSEALTVNLLELSKGGGLKTAGIGNDPLKATVATIRSDKTSWRDTASRNSAEMEFLDIVTRFIAYMNETCYTGLNAFEFHYALYEKGAFYGRHKDQFRNNANRKFSIISYLNEDWQTTDGGQLVIHHDGRAAQNVSPNSGKTVFFKSDKLEHEVTAATRPRMSVTGWLKRV